MIHALQHPLWNRIWAAGPLCRSQKLRGVESKAGKCVDLEMPVLPVMPWCRCCSKMCLHALENALIWRCPSVTYRLCCDISIPRFFFKDWTWRPAWRIVKLTEYCAWRDYCLQIASCLKARLYMKYRWTLFFADRYKAGIYGFVIFITKWIWFCYYNKIVCWMIMKSCWFRAL